jgi:C-methyltransferase C-terminal domain
LQETNQVDFARRLAISIGRRDDRYFKKSRQKFPGISLWRAHACFLPFVCDAASAKQGKFMPGSHIPILPPAVLMERRPDYLLILPWNIAAEIKKGNASLAERGTKFVTAVPMLEIV